jgi:hypothetical protein
MHIVIRVTGETILTCRLQRRNRRRIHMALCTLYSGMPAIQLESKSIVIEIVSVTIHPIVAFETTTSERHLVIHHEFHIHADVTCSTSKLIELGDILSVTICAKERFLHSR